METRCGPVSLRALNNASRETMTFEMRTLQCPWGQDLLLTLHDSELLEPFLIFSPLRFPWTSWFTWTEWAARNQGNPWNSR